MEIINKFIALLDTQIERPSMYGWFHISCIVAVILVTIFLVVKYKDCSEKTLRKIVFITWVIICLLEIYKQVVFAFDNETYEWEYDFYNFPFQFCSTPIYVFPLIVFLKDGKVRDACKSFISTFSLFAGLSVIVYPGTVLSKTAGINFQTMFHHGSQVVIGILIAVHEREKISVPYFLKSVLVFASSLAVAVCLNVLFHNLVPGDEANMFFIGPYEETVFPILKDIWLLVPWGVFILIYIIGFASISALTMYIEYLILRRSKLRKKQTV